MSALVKSGQEWTFEDIEEIYSHINRVAMEKYKLNIYPNQLEIITSEQMLDAYAAHGLPVFYPHWSFGEDFVKQLESYKRGYMGLAYEIVINSSPCIAYLMEENTFLMQTLVIAHASFGHNHFFKNNYLFKQWTDAEGIIDYLVFAKKFIRECEEKYGVHEVEATLDACHALQMQGIDKYRRPSKLSAAQEEALREERRAYIQSQVNDLWRTVPKTQRGIGIDSLERFPKEPEENLLYFIEKNAPRMLDWQRELVRIIRKVSQYFYPQMQTKLMNEGCATYFHYKIIHDLYDEGILDDGAMLEFYKSHTGVVFQPDYHSNYYSGINPYALGFAMYQDIERIAMDPTEEDREWFGSQEWVGSGDYLAAIKWAIENFKDESFVQQFLSPKVMRDFRLFAIHDDEKDPMYEVAAIHNKQGYKDVRTALAKEYNIGYHIPDIQVYDVDRWGDRTMTIRHYMVNKVPLDANSATETIQYLSWLWGYPVKLDSVDDNGEVRSSWTETGEGVLMDIFLDYAD